MWTRAVPCIGALILAASVAACGSTAPTPVGNAGEWRGTTIQGAPIAFTVSPDEKVTALTIGYDFNGCSGTHTFTGLSLETTPQITCIPGPCSPAISSYRAFGYTSSSEDRSVTSQSTFVNGVFLATGAAEGAAGFMNYPGCGTVLGVGWRATRR
jgi:hypothetical protein